MKKITSLILIITLLLISLIPVSYATDEISVYIDGVAVEFDQPPVIIDGRTLVPMRALFEALGASVTWYNDIQVAMASAPGISLFIFADNNHMTRNFIGVTLDAPARIINGRMFVPLRVISEVFGMNVEWNSSTQTISLTSLGTIGEYKINNFTYVGELKDNLPNGYGIITDDETKNTVYTGLVDFDKPYGLVEGARTYDDGTFFIGKFSDGKPSDGIKIFSNGDTFDGIFVNGEFESGKYTFSNGDIFDGTFVDGNYSYGIYYCSNGTIFEGSFSDNKPSEGTIVFPNNIVFTGTFKDGKMFKGIYTDDSGLVFDGSIINDKPYYGNFYDHDGNYLGLYDASTGLIYTTDEKYAPYTEYSSKYSSSVPTFSTTYSFPWKLYSNDGKTYLGELTPSDEYGKDSIWNEYGNYGSKYSSTSIWNKYGDYGSKYSDTSAFYKYANNPPVIVDRNGKFIGYLTANKYKTDGFTIYELMAFLTNNNQ